MTIEELREKGWIIMECISGSKAYGLDTPESDTDIKGVFLLPKEEFYGLNYIPQIANESNDIVFYEFRRFMELLAVNNPNILELLCTPDEAVLYKHPFMEAIQADMVLSKLCLKTFGKNAYSQVKKARGLNKKILNPVAKERKSLLSFCYLNRGDGALPLLDFLEENNWKQEDCGLVNIQHMDGIYGLYHAINEDYNGIIRDRDANDICLSSIPRGQQQIGLMYFNRNAYSTYCRDYKEYWSWVEKRNKSRYENSISHGKNYDAKNMMHVFRIMNMAIEIGREKKINMKRPDRDFLLDIKAGKFEYDELLAMVEEKKVELDKAFAQSELREEPDLTLINRWTFEIRERFYEEL